MGTVVVPQHLNSDPGSISRGANNSEGGFIGTQTIWIVSPCVSEGTYRRNDALWGFALKCDLVLITYSHIAWGSIYQGNEWKSVCCHSASSPWSKKQRHARNGNRVQEIYGAVFSRNTYWWSYLCEPRVISCNGGPGKLEEKNISADPQFGTHLMLPGWHKNLASSANPPQQCTVSWKLAQERGNGKWNEYI